LKKRNLCPREVYTSGTTPTARRFTGQISDDTIGLYFYNARYYDATLGRFVQADTIVPSPGDPQAFNRYSYVLNSPLVYRDPSGHAVEMYSNTIQGRIVVDRESLGGWRWLGLVGLSEVRHLRYADEIAEVAQAAKPWKKVVEALPIHTHHVISKYTGRWTPVIEDVVKKYNLDLEGAWNKIDIPHQGSHPREYHQWISDRLEMIDSKAEGSADKFMELFSKYIREPLRERPEMLIKDWWNER
jgi:RHS repeat-associated protein